MADNWRLRWNFFLLPSLLISRKGPSRQSARLSVITLLRRFMKESQWHRTVLMRHLKSTWSITQFPALKPAEIPEETFKERRLENKQIILFNDLCTLLIFRMRFWIGLNCVSVGVSRTPLSLSLPSQGRFCYFPRNEIRFSIVFRIQSRFLAFARRTRAASVNQFISFFLPNRIGSALSFLAGGLIEKWFRFGFSNAKAFDRQKSESKVWKSEQRCIPGTLRFPQSKRALVTSPPLLASATYAHHLRRRLQNICCALSEIWLFTLRNWRNIFRALIPNINPWWKQTNGKSFFRTRRELYPRSDCSPKCFFCMNSLIA